jgi:hypothetical protein
MAPRFLHLMGYYCRIRSRKAESEKHLKRAEAVAYAHSNDLELEWISHNRTVTKRPIFYIHSKVVSKFDEWH